MNARSGPTFDGIWLHLRFPLAELRHRQGLLVGRMNAMGFSARAEAGLETLALDMVKSVPLKGSR